MELEDMARMLVLLLGGGVVGAGGAILLSRRSYYLALELPKAARAMVTLSFVNALVLVYVTSILIDRWGDELSWRWALALGIFGVKGWFFHDLRATELEQERRRLYGDWPPA